MQAIHNKPPGFILIYLFKGRVWDVFLTLQMWILLPFDHLIKRGFRLNRLYGSHHVKTLESSMGTILTCGPSVPGCCSSLTVRPPAVLRLCPSCQVRFPPAQRLRWYLKSSGRALYSTAGRQNVKLEAANTKKRKTKRLSIYACRQFFNYMFAFIPPFRNTQTSEMYSSPVLWVSNLGSRGTYELLWKIQHILSVHCANILMPIKYYQDVYFKCFADKLCIRAWAKCINVNCLFGG